MQSWVAAWSNRNLDNYLNHYSGKFVPKDNLSLEEWKEQRNGRLLWREFIIVEVDGNNATARFTQYYKSDLFEGTGRKTLDLKQANGDWYITREQI